MKLRVSAEFPPSNTGIEEDALEIPDEELEGLSDEEREEVFRTYWEEWFWEVCNGGFTAEQE